MASASGRANLGLIDCLLAQPHGFDFFQAVRLLEWSAMHDGPSMEVHRRRGAVGLDTPPHREVARFRAAVSLSFPANGLVDLRASTPQPLSTPDEAPQYEMLVSFMGLTGPNGVLPWHYTRMLMERVREKDYSLRDFFDVFNHRMISLFYRAWEKYRFASGYVRSHAPLLDAGKTSAGKPSDDLFTHCLLSLVGMGTNGLRAKLLVDDESLLFYGGYFADHHRPAVSLERMLSDYFGLEAHIEQFQGQWLNLSVDDRSRIASAENSLGGNNRLGVDAVLGDRVWDVQSRFRVRLGPLDYQQYCSFTPAGDALVPLCQLVRTFVGMEFDFDVQPVLKATEVPTCQLGALRDAIPRLGWNIWLKSAEFAKDFEDAAFALES